MLDIHIRFWDYLKWMAVPQYFDSRFLSRLNADNMFAKLKL